jgi:hypothetical protein
LSKLFSHLISIVANIQVAWLINDFSFLSNDNYTSISIFDFSPDVIEEAVVWTSEQLDEVQSVTLVQKNYEESVKTSSTWCDLMDGDIWYAPTKNTRLFTS